MIATPDTGSPRRRDAPAGRAVALDGRLMRAVAPRFRGIWGRRQTAIIDAVGPVLGQTLALDGIDVPLRAAHFLAQCCHESAGFRTTEEFADGTAYEGRRDLGNLEPGDGPRFKGRGLLQLTGRANYRRFGAMLGLPLETEPWRAADPVTSLAIACAYWRLHGLNALADADDLEAVTRRVNGGLNGLDDRRRALGRAKEALGLTWSPLVAPPPPRLAIGAQGPAVARLQRALTAAGARLGIDGRFGPRTAAALRRVQAELGLVADGIAGPRTWAALGHPAGAGTPAGGPTGA